MLAKSVQKLPAFNEYDMCNVPHEFKSVISYRQFLDYTHQTVSMYHDVPGPTQVDLHDEEAFSEWLSMAKHYKSKGEIIQFVSDEDEWEAWIGYAMIYIEGQLETNDA